MLSSVKEEQKRRATLDMSNVLRQTRISLNKIPGANRAQALSEKEIQELPWLSTISKLETVNIIKPQDIKPNIAKPINRISEESLNDLQEDEKAPFTVNEFIETLTKGAGGGTFESIPLIDTVYEKNISQNKYIFTNVPDQIAFIHINEYNVAGKSGVGANSSVYIFTYNKRPLCEPVRIDFSTNPVSASCFGRKFNDFYLPYLDSPETYIFAILTSQEFSQDIMNEKPVAIGFIKACEIPNDTFSLNWVVHSLSEPLESHVNSTKKFPLFDLQFKYEKTKDLVDSSLTAKITAFNNMYPSPLLTVYDISVEVGAKKGAQFYCIYKIKTNEENPRELKAAAQPYKTDLNNISRGTYITSAEKIVFPEPINFILGPQSGTKNDVQLLFSVEIFSTKDGKQKSIQEITIPLEKASGEASSEVKSKGVFSGSKCKVSIKYIFPSVVFPPNSLLLSLISPPKRPIPGVESSKFLPDYNNPMFQDVAPYILQYLFDPMVIEMVDFRQFADIVQHCSKNWLYHWIEHFLVAPPNSAAVLLRAVASNISAIADIPEPFFLACMKAMVATNSASENEISELFKAVAATPSVAVVSSAARFLVIMRMRFDAAIVNKLAHGLIRRLPTDLRHIAFQILFGDIAFLQNMIPFAMRQLKVESPYIALLSLFFSTVRDSFLANNLTEIEPALTTIGVVGATIEKYVDANSSESVATVFFPLLTLIFTFYDSLLPHLGSNPVFVPFLLFLFKHTEFDQFNNYYQLLSDDNKLRLLEMIGSFADRETIIQLSERIEGLQNDKLSIAHEVTWRILLFLRFIERIKVFDERQLHAVFKILIAMLGEQQDSDAFPMVFSSFAFVVTKFKKEIFTEKTQHILQIISAAVEVTQRRLATARISAIAFIGWMLNFEVVIRNEETKTQSKDTKSKAKPNRVFIALNVGLAKTLFAKGDIRLFSDYLSDEYRVAAKITMKLKQTIQNSKVYYASCAALLTNVALIQNFPSLKYLLYNYIVRQSEANADYISAFVAQWHICGLIADVFRLRNTPVDGIPTSGMEAFPYMEAEPRITTDGMITKKSNYLMMVGDMFNEENIKNELIRALELCRQAKLHWLTGSITEVLLNYLEAHREFTSLVSVFSKIAESYNDLGSKNEKEIEFFLISYRGPIAEELGIQDSVQMCYKGGIEKIKKVISEAFPSVTFAPPRPLLLLTKEIYTSDVVQIVPVMYPKIAAKPPPSPALTQEELLAQKKREKSAPPQAKEASDLITPECLAIMEEEKRKKEEEAKKKEEEKAGEKKAEEKKVEEKKKEDKPKKEKEAEEKKKKEDEKELEERRQGLEQVKVWQFYIDVLEETEVGWNETFCNRVNIMVEQPLPRLVSFSRVIEYSNFPLSKTHYFTETLKEFIKKVRSNVEEFRAVMPPKKLEASWTKWGLSPNIEILKQCLKDTIGQAPSSIPLEFVKEYIRRGDTKKDNKNAKTKQQAQTRPRSATQNQARTPSQALTLTQVRSKIDLLKMDEAGKEVNDLAEEVKKVLAEAVKVIDELAVLNNRDRMAGSPVDSDLVIYKELLFPKKLVSNEVV